MPYAETEIMDRYHCLRAVSTRHHSGALGCLSRQAILERAKHLGLAYGQTLVAESEEEMTLLFDLAIYTAKRGRSRAIDRYAKSVMLQPGSDEALTLDAMCQARFSLWRIERRHETAGVIVADLLRDRETWLLDQGLAHSANPRRCRDDRRRLLRQHSLIITCRSKEVSGRSAVPCGDLSEGNPERHHGKRCL